jgi:hypothetical protein
VEIWLDRDFGLPDRGRVPWVIFVIFFCSNATFFLISGICFALWFRTQTVCLIKKKVAFEQKKITKITHGTRPRSGRPKSRSRQISTEKKMIGRPTVFFQPKFRSTVKKRSTADRNYICYFHSAVATAWDQTVDRFPTSGFGGRYDRQSKPPTVEITDGRDPSGRDRRPK